jgi:hypothetical protein
MIDLRRSHRAIEMSVLPRGLLPTGNNTVGFNNGIFSGGSLTSVPTD